MQDYLATIISLYIYYEIVRTLVWYRTVPTSYDERPAGFWRHLPRTLAKATSVRIRDIIRTPRVMPQF